MVAKVPKKIPNQGKQSLASILLQIFEVHVDVPLDTNLQPVNSGQI